MSSNNQSGQSTVEYILILAIVAVVSAIVLRDVLKPAIDRVRVRVSQGVESLFQPENLHSFPIRK